MIFHKHISKMWCFNHQQYNRELMIYISILIKYNIIYKYQQYDRLTEFGFSLDDLKGIHSDHRGYTTTDVMNSMYFTGNTG